MKRFFTICLLFLYNLGFSQNVMFFNFNERYEKVIKELKSYPCDSLYQTDKAAPLIAFYQGFKARYYFNGYNRLYKVEVSKIYDSQKDAKEAVDGALVYFDKIRAYMTSSTKYKYKKYRAHRKDNMYEIEVTTYAENDIEIRLDGWNENLQPADQYEPDYANMKLTRREREAEEEDNKGEEALNITAKE